VDNSLSNEGSFSLYWQLLLQPDGRRLGPAYHGGHLHRGRHLLLPGPHLWRVCVMAFVRRSLHGPCFLGKNEITASFRNRQSGAVTSTATYGDIELDIADLHNCCSFGG